MNKPLRNFLGLVAVAYASMNTPALADSNVICTESAIEIFNVGKKEYDDGKIRV